MVPSKYDHLRAPILALVAKNPGISGPEISELVGVAHDVAPDIVTNLVSRMIGKKQLFIRKAIRDKHQVYQYFLTPPPAEDPELLRRRTQPKRKSTADIVAAQAELPLPAPAVVPEVPVPVPVVEIAPAPTFSFAVGSNGMVSHLQVNVGKAVYCVAVKHVRELRNALDAALSMLATPL